MAQRRSQSAFFGAILAMIAMFGLATLSGWHSATVHDHDPHHAASIEHDHDYGRSKMGDLDAPLHLLAHAAGQWVAPAGPFAAPIVSFIAGNAWPVVDAILSAGIDPSELLRPPQG
ncbi:hypothetical protein [Sphingomonas faeni]|uniref:hypothetical protein n=1 Tax=Sphingomonas faeni TaxID=185950 RepID=UPI0020C76E0E|nr:hypothetical protein [Sphingomonas faeni]MCP8892300.1 hypothetical protein [Sphingomonas faeni]